MFNIAKVLDVVKLQALYVVRKLGDLSVGSKLTLIRGISSSGRAPALQAGGDRFEPDILHHICQCRLAKSNRHYRRHVVTAARFDSLIDTKILLLLCCIIVIVGKGHNAGAPRDLRV